MCLSGNEHTTPSFTAVAFSGAADCSIDIWLPHVQGLMPSAAIKWMYGGMDIFGYGFSFAVPYFMRRQDEFIHPLHGVLIPSQDGATYYPRVQRLFSRIKYLEQEDLFEETGKDGTVTLYGACPGKNRYIYYPARSVDLRGNTILYSYRAGGEIEKLEYGNLRGGGYAFRMAFSYENRPDIAKDFRGGITQAFRCSKITISSAFDKERVLREIFFEYDESKGYSLLSLVRETAYSDGIKDSAPPITLSYTKAKPESFTKFSADADIGNAVPISLEREGASGLLYQYPTAAFYAKAIRQRGETAPAFAPRVMIKNYPYTGSFMDLDGDGNLQWVLSNGRGYHEYANGCFSRFTAFESICPVDANTEFADILGDGKASAFTVTGKQAELYRSLGRKGFGKVKIINLPKGFPAASFFGKRFSRFVRFFGDGLMHRVSITQNSCTVFPNLGKGNFGDGISVNGFPDLGKDFDVSRLRFADTTGSGTDDIIYIKQHEIRVYRNIGGAFFGEAQTVPLPEPFAFSDSVYIANFTGDILPQLIFIKGERAYYLRLSHEFLLNAVTNGYGISTEAEYISSAAFVLEDGPPFHKPVVSGLKRLDCVTGEESVSAFSYYNGRYVTYDRALYGFGAVHENHKMSVPLPEGIPGDVLPGEGTTVNTFYIGDHENMPLDQFALVGQPLETTIFYGGHVLKKTSRSYSVNPQLSFFPALIKEEITVGEQDPRIMRTSYSYDVYGNVVIKQECDRVLETVTDFINIDDGQCYCVGIPSRVSCFSGEAHQLASMREFFYADPNTGAVLPFGESKSPALLHHTRDAVFLSDYPYIAELTDVLHDHCGYVLENGIYFTHGSVYTYDKDCFHKIISEKLGETVTVITYDTYGMLVTGITRVLTDEISLTEVYTPDYTVLAYSAITDMNGNKESYLYDAFGMLRGIYYGSVAPLLSTPRSHDDIIASPKQFLPEGLDAFFYYSRGVSSCKVSVRRKCENNIACNVDVFNGNREETGQALYENGKWIIEKAVYANGLKLLQYPAYFGESPFDKPANLYPAVFSYDILGRVTKEYSAYSESPLWRAVEYEYGAWHIEIKDKRLAPSVLIYRKELNLRGEEISERYVNEDVLRYKRRIDDNGRITALADGRLSAQGVYNMQYRYDMLGRVTHTVSVDVGEAVTLYGTGGRLVYEISKGVKKAYSYDALGRLTAVSVLDGGEWVAVQLTLWGESTPNPLDYNLMGRVFSRESLGETVTYPAYDRFGNAVRIERHYRNHTKVDARYEYNQAGELIHAVTGGFSLSFTYTSAGRVSAVYSEESEIFREIQYTADGRIAAEHGTNGLSAAQLFDPVTQNVTAQMVTQNGVNLHKADYSFTARHNLSSIIFETAGASVFNGTYTYDVHNRLIGTSETKNGCTVSEGYVYDHGGNIIELKRMENTETIRIFDIAQGSNRLNAVTTNGVRFEYAYNEYGAPQHLDGHSLQYDILGRLMSVDNEAGRELYSYDENGKRINKQAGENYTQYFSGNPLAGEYARTNDKTEMLQIKYGILNAVLVKTDAVELFWQITDHRNSVILTADSLGNVLFHEIFSPYGEAPEASQVLDEKMPVIYRFGGKEYEHGTGLYYFGTRFYSPETGRMITPDDTEFALAAGLSGLNLYVYGLGNPVTLTDSTGNWPHWVGVVGKLAIVGAATGAALFLGAPAVVTGTVATAGLGVALGMSYSSVTPKRAAVTAAIAAAVGEFITTPGGFHERLVSAGNAGAIVLAETFTFNMAKEGVLALMPRIAREHPLAAGVVTTIANVGFTTYVGIAHRSEIATAPIILGMMGGNELGVVGSLIVGETGVRLNPKTLGNEIPRASVIEQPLPGGGVLVEYNPSERRQWAGRLDTITGYFDERGNLGNAESVVIVHGGVGGLSFIDGSVPPVSHTIIDAGTLAADLLERLPPNNSTIKLISCHGSEHLPPHLSESTATTLTRDLRRPVIAYEGAISIGETIPSRGYGTRGRRFG